MRFFLLLCVATGLFAEETKPPSVAQVVAERDHWRAQAINFSNLSAYRSHELELLKLSYAIQESQRAVETTKSALCLGQQVDEKKYAAGDISCVDKPKDEPVKSDVK